MHYGQYDWYLYCVVDLHNSTKCNKIFYSFTRICFLWSDSVLALPSYTPSTRPISTRPNTEKGGYVPRARIQRDSKDLYTIVTSTRASHPSTPTQHWLSGFPPPAKLERSNNTEATAGRGKHFHTTAHQNTTKTTDLGKKLRAPCSCFP